MNIKTMLSLVFIGGLTLTSCKNESADVQQDIEEVSSDLPTSTTPAPTETELQESVQESAPVQQNVLPAPVPSQRLNPAHGEPNHRCDIEVGAPLPM